jgi:dTMP kinase
MPSSRRGIFVSLEGIEGCGKTVQATRLERAALDHGIPCLATREPGGTAFGDQLRSILLETNGPSREPSAELLVYLADRYQHWKEIIAPALSAGLLVICDRYHDASLAYQGHARGLGFDLVEELASPLRLGQTDLTIVLDLEVERGLQRARARDQLGRDSGRFEAEDLDFHRRVREGYRLIEERAAGRVVRVDASGTPDQVHAAIMNTLRSRGLLPKA